ncbi:MAG: hypothetical protein AAF745_09800, partial [Planctomycetota bacterium]
MQTSLTPSAVESILNGTAETGNLLGCHEVRYRGELARAVRLFRPEAESLWVIDSANGIRRMMRKVHPEGFFEAICEPSDSPLQIEMIDKSGQKTHSTTSSEKNSVIESRSGSSMTSSVSRNNSAAQTSEMQASRMQTSGMQSPEPDQIGSAATTAAESHAGATSLLSDFDRYLFGEGRL